MVAGAENRDEIIDSDSATEQTMVMKGVQMTIFQMKP
jgi:hypothetical protein